MEKNKKVVQNTNLNSNEDITSIEKIAKYVSEVKFKKKFFAGVDPIDVWKKIAVIDEMYQKAFEEQQIKYETLIREREKLCSTLQKKCQKYQSSYNGSDTVK